jgi:hypothetical protein
MKMVVFDSEASDELHATARYYEEKREGLGDEFMEEVEQAKERIGRMPQAFPLHTGSDLRKCILSAVPVHDLLPRTRGSRLDRRRGPPETPPRLLVWAAT